MSNTMYGLYKETKRTIKRVKNHWEKDPDNEAYIKSLEETIEALDKAEPLYAKRYEREEALIASFTPEQIDHICYQIGDWYLMMKPLLEGQHNLGYMKEKLKIMICGE